MKTKKKKKFFRKQAKRIKSETQKRKKKRLHVIGSFIGKTANLILLLSVSAIISFIWQQRIAMPFLTYHKAAGGDYFNALTYAKFFAENKPLPFNGWMPFWNGGIPIIGGYPTLFFYLMLPLTSFFDIASSMELLSIILILFFLIASHFLFWEASRNHILALIFTGILIISPATYYALVAEGLVIGSAMQWLLPATLFFIIRFTKFQETQTLVAAAIFAGLALAIHPAMALVTVFIPSSLFLLMAGSGDPQNIQQIIKLRSLKKTISVSIKAKATQLTLFTFISASIGSIGLYTLILQTFFSAGSGACDNPQCWGVYPNHFSWFSPLIIPALIAYFPTILLTWRNLKLRFSEVLAPLASLSLIIAYVLAAWLHLIDNLSSAIFPRRLFWAISLLALLCAASYSRFISKTSKKLAVAAGSLFTIMFIISLLPILPSIIRFNLRTQLKIPNSLPTEVDSFIVPKYQKQPLTDVVPTWIPLTENNWRLDSVRPDFLVWWNTVSKMPATRGYSNSPTLENLNWTYYLQVSTLTPSLVEELTESARLNRALFLLDGFGIKILHEAGIAYDKLLIHYPNVVSRSQKIREWTFYEIDEKITSPIISPTNATRVLIVSDQGGYDAFIRAISLTNLNSKIIIPIKGPESVDKLNPELLEMADVLVLYQFTGTNWSKVEKFVESGGNLFVDIGSLENLPTTAPEILGMKGLQLHDQEREWKLTKESSTILTDIQTAGFSPLLFENKPWKIAAPPSDTFLSDWMEPILLQKNIPILAQGQFGKGTVVFSGFNLPYHIVNYSNHQEAKLLKNIISELSPELEDIGKYSAQRPKPTFITASTEKARGVYFKENYHSGWKASINGEKTPIYKAGLGFMYIPIPPESPQDTSQIELKFKGNLTTWGLPILTSSTLILCVLFILSTRPFKAVRNLTYRIITKRIKRWWASD